MSALEPHQWEVEAQLIFNMLWGGTFTSPLTAVSQTRQITKPYLSLDYGSFWVPVRTCIVLSIMPPLYIPLGVTHAYGYLRCLATTHWPWSADVVPQLYEEGLQYCVYKRYHDKRTKRLSEHYVEDPSQLARALAVTGHIRGMFVDDEADPHVAYNVVERRTYTTNGMFKYSRFAILAASDLLRYCVPAALCFFFHRPAMRIATDLVQVSQGRLAFNQIRHPVTNFFTSVKDYQRAQNRVNITRAPPKGAKPWHYDL